MEIVLFQMQQYPTLTPERVQLLQVLTRVLFGLDASDEALVFKCSEKIYQEMPSLVIRCFIDEEGMIGHLNIYHVVKHLQQLTANKPTVFERNELVLQYLSVVTPHLASFAATDVALDHNLSHTLAVLYIDSIHDLMKRECVVKNEECECVVKNEECDSNPENENCDSVVKNEKCDSVVKSDNHNPNAENDTHNTNPKMENHSTAENSPSENEKRIASLRASLQNLLRTNRCYLPDLLLSMIKEDELLEERCVPPSLPPSSLDPLRADAPPRGGAHHPSVQAAVGRQGAGVLRRSGEEGRGGGPASLSPSPPPACSVVLDHQ